MGFEATFDEMCRDHDLRYIWTCDKCGDEREDVPGCNEGGRCYCGGTYYKSGESYCSPQNYI